jgi:DNA-directed RNA polymerase subunit M/transcription elongation factor TFIIS
MSDEDRQSDDETYDLEPVEPVEPVETTDDDDIATDAVERAASSDRRCQSCGAPMPEDESVMVCPSCGYDIVTNRVIDPAKAAQDVADDEHADHEPEEPAAPLFADASWKPYLIPAAVLLASVAFAMIAGWSSFYPRDAGRFFDEGGAAVLDAPRVSLRFGAVLRLFVGSGVLVACGLAAARATAWAEERPLGDLRGAASRLGLAVALAALVRLLPIDSVVLQNVVHGVLGIAAIALISMLVIGNRGRVLGLFLVGWALAFLLVVPVARLVAWSIPIF